jgi:flagellar motor switch protein FliG
MSKRAAAMLKEDMEYMKPESFKELKAQQKIALIILRHGLAAMK